MAKRLEGIRSLATNVFNPLVLKFAGARFSPFAALYHTGRRSGKQYRTPLYIKRTRGGFVLSLPYGFEVDWYRNMLAAGGATLHWHGREFSVAQPTTLDTQSAFAAFPLPQKLFLRGFRIKDFALARVKAVKREK